MKQLFINLWIESSHLWLFEDIQNTEGARDEKNDIVDDIQTLLSPLYETSACLLRTKDWWTYEVCPLQICK